MIETSEHNVYVFPEDFEVDVYGRKQEMRPRQTGRMSKQMVLNGLGSQYLCGIALSKFVGARGKTELSQVQI